MCSNGERGGEAAANPVAAALLDTIARFALPTEPLLDLVEAHAFDLYDDPMPTLAALEAYARKTSRLFAQAARSAARPRAADEAAEHAGIAWAITDLLRNFARHASRRQVFVPVELLERHGTRVEDVTAGQASEGLRRRSRRCASKRAGISWRSSSARRGCRAADAGVPAGRAGARLSGGDGAPRLRPVPPPIEVAQWRRQWALWRAARRYAGTMRG